MQTDIIDAADLIDFCRGLRANNQRLIRAKPFRRDGTDCYHVMYA